MVKPSGKRKIVKYLLDSYKGSIQLVCSTVGLHRSMWYYQVKKDDSDVETKLNEYAEKYPTYGFDEYYWRIRREGYVWNRKRVLRVYRKMKLGLRRKRKRPYPVRDPKPLEEQTKPNEVWSLDFMSDSLDDGRRIRVLNVIDDYNREALVTEVGISFPSERVVRILDQLIEERGKPKMLRTDNGSEFIAKAYKEWCYKNEIIPEYIKPGKPTQNAYIERFNQEFRKGVLNAYLFKSVQDMRMKAEEWRYDYNHYHPHKSLGRRTPKELWDDFVKSGKLSKFTTINKVDNDNIFKYLSNLELS